MLEVADIATCTNDEGFDIALHGVEVSPVM